MIAIEIDAAHEHFLGAQHLHIETWNRETTLVVYPLATGDRGVFNKGDLDWGTRVLIENAEVPRGGVLLDLGCGSGAIAAALATLRPDATVWAVDVNERAVDVARRTMQLNGLTNVRVALADEVPHDLRFDGIWSNPPIRVGKDELHHLLSTWLARLAAAGTADLVVHGTK
ncbi:MAG: methyltransferase domain-containing protein [Actinobacteria bacterium]|nr:methyltransferase domain-containing protein [Actinomycetota bacterium]